MKIFKKMYWFLKALAANIWYDFPSKKIIVVGVTGTDGKTTTTTMIYHMLTSLGEKVSYISTVKAVVAGKTYDLGFHVTTPSAFFIQKQIKRAVDNGDKYVVLEVTSHGLDQLRVWGCTFKVGAITNITKEHLDYHKNIKEYGNTKLKLLNSSEIAVVNADNPTHYLFRNSIKNKSLWFCSIQKKADFTLSDLKVHGLNSEIDGFQAENMVLAYAVLCVLGFDEKKAARSLNSFKNVRGRLDYFEKNNKRFLIDFAHTPNSFKRLFEYVEKNYTYRHIVHVFGCAGKRDAIKRPVMGRYSAQECNTIILTEEDYRTENIETIFNDIEKGIRKEKKHEKGKNYFCIPDRLEAIRHAIQTATSEDIILLTGKAHEQSLARGNKEYHWDEYEAVDKALSKNTHAISSAGHAV
ncbi:MAG: UDP-N-acetylmuramyl-tripeptide synthetase [Candidatus Roizmanbacteria bacterium]|nr:UDP-N-acetylmuramyl-tripeptide synthetase [Candidatus Roizmanbacteria bacterium]